MRIKFVIVFIGCLIIFGSLSIVQAESDRGGYVYSITVKGDINEGVKNFIERSISRAESDNVPLIIEINTPGGLVASTEDIVGRMLNAEITIVMWVTPPGAWAFSAGTYILLASNVAAMDDGTVIGACEPRPAENKEVSAMAGWIMEIAEKRGRPRDIAAEFVLQNRTMGPRDALDNGVIDLIAYDVDDLLDYLGMPGAEVRPIEMGVISKILSVLSNPQVVLILFIAGLFGIIAEVTTPGIGVPGVAGCICLLLSLWGLHVIQLNWAGIALIALAAALLAAEVFTPGFGVFGVGGAIALILGVMMIGREPWAEVATGAVKGVLLVLFGALVAFVIIARRALKRPVAVGAEAMLGEVGVAETNIAPKGLVKVKGELWTARSKVRIEKGEKVVVRNVIGLELVVSRYRERRRA